MKTSTGYTSHTSYKRIIALILLPLVLLGVTSSCARIFYKKPIKVINNFLEDLKNEFPYVTQLKLHSISPAHVEWECWISENRNILGISDFIIRLKEFALDDATSDALVETGDFCATDQLISLGIIVYYGIGKDSTMIFYTACHPNNDDYTWEWLNNTTK